MMPGRYYLAAMLIMFGPGGAAAQQADPDDSMIEHAEDAARTPARDLNLDKRDIPRKLIEIQEDPYSLVGLSRCRALIAEVTELNAVLGPDVNEVIEKSKTEKREETASRVGGGLLGGLIPFRGVVREVTGAAAAQRRLDRAIYAGVVRRGFLKGVGLQRGCKAPGRP
jgi:hypothetical protein